MKLSDAGELVLLDAVRRKFGGRGRGGLVCGIGDDAAVVKPGKRSMLLTTDMMVEGVHFDFRWTTPFQLGFKLVSVNTSDIFAMGGKAEYLLLNFAAPGGSDISLFRRFFDGIEKAAEAYGLILAGGDMSSSDRVVVSATVVGSAAKILTRAGARVGDWIYVTGHPGDAACGLEIMKKLGRPIEIERRKKIVEVSGWRTIQPLIRRHLMPVAVDPRRFVSSATAMIDVSDGLLIDLERLCNESGVGARLEAASIPISRELRKAAVRMGLDPMDLALGGGEDYELLFTCPAGKKIEAVRIGEITSGGMALVDETGRPGRMPAKGYRHFVA